MKIQRLTTKGTKVSRRTQGGGEGSRGSRVQGLMGLRVQGLVCLVGLEVIA